MAYKKRCETTYRARHRPMLQGVSKI